MVSDQNLDVFVYHEELEAVTWATSTMRSWLNGLAENEGNGGDAIDYTAKGANFLTSAFSEKEQAAIATTYVINAAYGANSTSNPNPSYDILGGDNTRDKVFLLSIAEANNTSYFANDKGRIATNTAYVYGGGKTGTKGMFGVGEADYWWLRSPGDATSKAALVLCNGGVALDGSVVVDTLIVRPAFNLNLSSVLFTSAATGGKSSAAEVGSGTEISKNAALSTFTDNDGYKLTLKDSDRTFVVSDTQARTVKPGDTLSLEYTGAKTGTNEYISAMITNASGEVSYYGQLAQPTSESGTAAFVVPSDIIGGEYTMKLFNEQINGDYKTDYSSEFVDISLTVSNLTFNTNGGTINSGNLVYYTEGEAATLPTDVTKDGYTFVGWYANEDFAGDKVTEIAATETGNKTYYAKWTIIPAAAPALGIISDLTGENALTYGEITADDKLTVTATADSGAEYNLTYQWHKATSASSKDGATDITGATEASYAIPTGTAAGDYYYYCTVTATRTDNDEFVKSETGIISVTVKKKPVIIDWGTTSFVYDGMEKAVNPTVTNAVSGDTVNLTIEGTTTATNKGEYTATVTAIDNENYTLINGENLTKNWSVAEMINSFTTNLAITGWVFGETPNAPTATAAFGTPEYTYSSSIDGAYSSDVPTEAGTYYVKATVTGTENYAELVSEAVEFVIGQKVLYADNINTIADVVYTGEEIRPVIEVMDGNTVLVLDTDYEVDYQNNINAGSAEAIVTFKGNYKGQAKREFTILPKPINTEIPLTAPASNAAPQTKIETDEYTATVVWSPEVTDKFAYSTAYTATITITPKENYAVTGVLENNYTVGGAETVTNEADSATVTVTYAETGRRPSGGGTTRYTVKFETNGGNTIASKTATRNSTISEPTAPTKDGYTFDGWYTDKELTTAYDFDTKVTKAITLYAKWTEDKTEESDNDNKPGTSDTECDGTIADACPSLDFDDLDVKAWYHLDTDYVIENDIFRGITETTFTPNGNITRAMMITVLYRAEGEPEVTGETTFEDVDSGAYYAKAVVWGQQNGIIKGYSETEYAPEQDILREQIAAIMHRYAQYKGYDVQSGENTNILSYSDFDSISEYAIVSMQWAVGSGLIKGKSESTLNPLDNATRAEAAAILHRFIEANK